MKNFFLLLFGIALLPISAGADEVPIKGFQMVTPDIYRGAQPKAEGIQALASLGFKTILNIDNDKSDIEKERKLANEFGINMVSLPMPSFWKPKDEIVNQALEVLMNPDNFPIFLHCTNGKDRTGVIAVLYRVEKQGWPKDLAYQEMLELGFHKTLVMLNRYVKKRLDYEDVELH